MCMYINNQIDFIIKKTILFMYRKKLDETQKTTDRLLKSSKAANKKVYIYLLDLFFMN